MSEKPFKTRRRNPSAKNAIQSRATALALMQAVLRRQRPLDQEFETNTALKELEARDQGLVRMIVLTLFRRLGEIDWVIANCLDRPLPAAGKQAQDLLRLGLCQVLYLDIPDHASVNTTVELAQATGAGPYKSVINAILRRVIREGQGLKKAASLPGRALPTWLFDRWTKTYGEIIAAQMADALKQAPPLDIAVRSDPAFWAERLQGTLLATGAVRLDAPGAIENLDGFDEGAWWVQDAAAQLPVLALGDVRGKTIIDLCAAPGGKTAALANAGANVIAVDRSKARLRRLEDNLKRLSLSATVICEDGTKLAMEEPVDAVLVDAPCSATGTLRRHPDTAWLKSEQDINNLSALQARLINHAADLIKPGGHMVFCSCSLEPEEGVDQARYIIENEALGLCLEPISASEIPGVAGLITDQGMIQTLPSHWPDQGGMDGFFAARFRKAN